MRVMGIAVRAAVVAFAASYGSTGAWAQFAPLGAGDDELAKATSEIDAMAETAREAAAVDNCVRKNLYTNRIWAIYRDEKNPFWRRHHFESLARTTTTGLAQLETHMREVVEQLNQLPCPKPAAGVSIGSRQAVEADIAAGGIKAVLPHRGFLGSETGVGSNRQLGLSAPDRDATGASISVSLKFDTSGLLSVPLKFGSGASSTWAKISFFYARASSDQTIGTVDAGAGNRLLFPGPEGFGSGFFTNPGNPAQGVTYSNDLSKVGGRVDFGQTTHFPISVSVDLYGSLGYAHTSFDERFSGMVVSRDFSYDSNARVDQFKLRFGVGLRKDVALQGGLTFSYGGYAEFGPDFSWGSGHDRLSLTGFADSTASPSSSHTAAGYRLGLTAGVQTPAGFKVSFEGAYMRESALPVFDRDGNNPTRLELKSGDVWTGMVRGTLRF
jgi:hypothetical protein